MADWDLGGTRIFVQEHEESNSQILPRLQPLSGGTVIQIFGYESKVVKIGALIVGTTDRNDLRAMAKDGNTHTLTYWNGNTIDFYVKSVSFKQRPTVCQTIRPDLSETAPIFDVALELIVED
jgi:hypothetical protein